MTMNAEVMYVQAQLFYLLLSSITDWTENLKAKNVLILVFYFLYLFSNERLS